MSQTTTQANSILQSHFLDPDTMARLPLAARPPLDTFIHRNNQPTLRQYNSLRLNPQIVGDLLDSSPGSSSTTPSASPPGTASPGSTATRARWSPQSDGTWN